MNHHKKLRLIGSFLCLLLFSGVSMTSLNSCIKDADEPYFEKPGTGDSDDNTGNETPDDEKPDDGEDKPGEPGDSEITDNIKDTASGQTLETTAVVTAQSGRGLILSDKGASIFYYNNNVDLEKYSIGTIVKVSGQVSAYGTGLQLSNTATLTVVGEDDNFKYPEPEVYTAAMVDAAAANSTPETAQYVSIEGQLSISGNYYNIIIPGADATGSLYTPTSELIAQLTDGNTYTFTGYFTGVSNSQYFNMVLTEVKGDESNGENSGGNDTDPSNGYDEVPASYRYPLSYVALPEGTPQQVKEYTGFTVNFNKDNHTANYVAWELLKSETSGSANRDDFKYWVDSSMEGCLSTDFAYSTYSYERGHMCPAADQKWSEAAMNDSMVMTNMCPQYRSLNSGLWGTLENKERTWAKRDGAIWIVAGPIYYDDDDLYIGKAKARVPSAYFKAFLYIDTDNPRAIAFVFQNGANPGDIKEYAMTIDELEKQTGYDFFSALPDEIENKIEAEDSYSSWNK